MNVPPDKQAILIDDYPLFRIQFADRTDIHAHGYFAAARVLDRAYLLHMVGFSGPTALPGYQVRVKEFGGNFVTDLTNGRQGIHSCEPVLDARDDERRSRQLDILGVKKLLSGAREYFPRLQTENGAAEPRVVGLKF